MKGELADHFETTDGSRPNAAPLSDALARRWPLFAFGLLQGGDAFEVTSGSPPGGGLEQAWAYARSRLLIEPHGASAERVEAVRADVARQLSGNLQLLSRMEAARPIAVDLVPPGLPLWKLGYPKAASRRAAGLFWDDPSWDAARVALRQEALPATPALVFHELAHAIQYLGFSGEERELLYRLLLRTFRSHQAVDEVFAIYSEREFIGEFSAKDRRAPGVYGVARGLWSEDQVLTRFVRNLYFPYRPLAGSAPRPAGPGGFFG